MVWNHILSSQLCRFNNASLEWQGFIGASQIFLFWVSELRSDKANLLFRVAKTIPDMPPVFDWKQVNLSDFVFCQKLKLLRIPVHPQTYSTALTTTPLEL